MNDRLTSTLEPLVKLGLDRPRLVLRVAAALTIVLGAAMVFIEVDTDPENMLPGDHPVRQLNAELRERFDGHETIVLGVTAADGDITSDDELAAVLSIHAQITGLDGVLGGSTVSIASSPAAAGSSDELVAAVAADPLLGGLVLTDDGATAAVFIAVIDKDVAADVADETRALVEADAAFADADVAVAGLPLAEDAFGQQMFLQMGIYAPLAGAVVFAVMLFFFRRLAIVVPAMVVALGSVIWTMGLLIGTGNTVHIMASMIPIFLMPTAILDSVHVISEHFDRDDDGDARDGLLAVYRELLRPLTYTTLTTMVAFGSLALAPIPPVQVFGVFVGIGMVIAWLWTLMVLPALLIGRRAQTAAPAHDPGALGVALERLGRLVVRRRRYVIATFAIAVLALAPGLAGIEVNDNPVRWFRSSEEIRQDSEALNEALPGTFGANVVLRAEDPALLVAPATLAALDHLDEVWAETGTVGYSAHVGDLVGGSSGPEALSAIDSARAASPLASTLIDDDGRTANVRLLLSDGDNQAMRAVVDATEAALAEVPLPDGVTTELGGEAYLNLVWQDEMVDGMLRAFLSTLVVVAVLLVLLFRSVRWAVLAMIPVVWTVIVVYGVIGYSGRDYDMPIAVLSTLVLGIGVDFAIHFVARFRALLDELGDPHGALSHFFDEPARALTRNALVIAVGFLPLVLSSLVPYVVVGVLLSAILVVSWLATVTVLPALASYGGRGPDVASSGEAVRPASADDDQRLARR
ncbi:MAG: MMPL family transporter [Actinomycetota bacterium]